MLSVLFKQLTFGIPFIKKPEHCKKSPPTVQKRILFIRGILSLNRKSIYNCSPYCKANFQFHKKNLFYNISYYPMRIVQRNPCIRRSKKLI